MAYYPKPRKYETLKPPAIDWRFEKWGIYMIVELTI